MSSVTIALDRERASGFWRLMNSLRILMCVERPGIKPVWSALIIVVITLFSLSAKIFERILRFVLINDIGLYESHYNRSLFGFGIKTIRASRSESGSISSIIIGCSNVAL